jgi:FtsZ-binding cell division protein ZapB
MMSKSNGNAEYIKRMEEAVKNAFKTMKVLKDENDSLKSNNLKLESENTALKKRIQNLLDTNNTSSTKALNLNDV